MASIDKINEDIAKSKERTDQLIRQKKAIEARERKKARALDTRQKIISGAILLDIFPQFKTLRPQRTNAEDSAEFAPLANFLKAVAADTAAVARYTEKARQRTAAQHLEAQADAPPKNQ